MNTHEPRLLTPADLNKYIAFRLEMLEAAPWAFLTTPDEVKEQVSAAQLARPQNEIVAIDHESEDRLIAAAGIYRSTREKSAHRASIWGVFTAASHRSRGLGEAVVRRAIEEAATWDGVDTITICVTRPGETARRLYERIGFQAWGVEPDAMRVGGESLDEIHMMMRIRQ